MSPFYSRHSYPVSTTNALVCAPTHPWTTCVALVRNAGEAQGGRGGSYMAGNRKHARLGERVGGHYARHEGTGWGEVEYCSYWDSARRGALVGRRRGRGEMLLAGWRAMELLYGRCAKCRRRVSHVNPESTLLRLAHRPATLVRLLSSSLTPRRQSARVSHESAQPQSDSPWARDRSADSCC